MTIHNETGTGVDPTTRLHQSMGEPFAWTRTADEIIDKVTRGRATLDRITNPATHH